MGVKPYRWVGSSPFGKPFKMLESTRTLIPEVPLLNVLEIKRHSWPTDLVYGCFLRCSHGLSNGELFFSLFVVVCQIFNTMHTLYGSNSTQAYSLHPLWAEAWSSDQGMQDHENEKI